MQFSSLPLPVTPTFESLSALAPDVSGVRDALKATAPWIATIAAAVTVEAVVQLSHDALLCVAGVALDSGFAALGTVAMVSAFRHCMDEKNSFYSLEGLSILTNGLSALSSLDSVLTVAAGVGLGIAEFSGVVGAMVTVVTFATRVRDGDVPGAILSGAKLLAMVALTGHPVALGIVLGANGAYSLYCAYKAYSASQTGTETVDTTAAPSSNEPSPDAGTRALPAVRPAWDEGWDLPWISAPFPPSGL
jgi:hypothetical protein